MFDVKDLAQSPLVFAAVTLLSAVTGVPPATVPNVAAGAIYGPFQGTYIYVAVSTIGACISMVMVRTFLRGFLMKKFAQYEARWKALDGAVAKEGAFTIVTLLRLSPAMPFAPASLLLGLTSVDLVPFALGTGPVCCRSAWSTPG